MGYMLAAVLISFTCSLLFIWQANNGATWGHDTDFDGPQKVHHKSVPRLGGVGIFVAVAACAMAARFLNSPHSRELAVLIARLSEALLRLLFELFEVQVQDAGVSVAGAGGGGGGPGGQPHLKAAKAPIPNLGDVQSPSR